MSAPVGRREFFALEAGEYLERLALLAVASPAPDAAELVRHARALRGAALMAGPPGFAIAASAFEGLAKAVQEGRRAWDAALADAVADAVETGKALLRRLAQWTEVDQARCEAVADALDGLAGGGRRRPAAAPAATGVSPGVRAFVAREAAGVAATLDRVAGALEGRPQLDATAPLAHRLQPLRGMGALPGLSPLPELLDVLDAVLSAHARNGAWPRDAGKAFRASGVAMARMARDIAEAGAPEAGAEELLRATAFLQEAFASEADVVDVATLAPAGTDPVASRGFLPPPPAVPLDPVVELTGLAERLRHAAGHAEPGTPRATRELTLLSLTLALRGLALSPAVRAAVGPFLESLAREAGRGRTDPDAVGRAAEEIAAVARVGDLGALAGRLAPLALQLGADAGVVPIESLAPEAAVVPIESLAPDADVVPVETLLLPPLLPFEQSFSTWFALARGESARPAVEAAPVPIESLLLRGRAALERADQVRRELDAALRRRRDLAGVEALLAELLDLVPLALDEAR